MPLIDYIDGPNRDIYLDISTMNTEIKPIDIYKEMRTLRATDESLRKYDLFMEASGNETKATGKFTERLTKFLQGTRLIPYDASHFITVTGTMFDDAGNEGIDLFDKTGLSAGTDVDINYFPPQVEVILVDGGGGLTVAENARLFETLTKKGYLGTTK